MNQDTLSEKIEVIDETASRLEDEQTTDEYQETELKVRINNLLWMYLPADTTLRDAETVACEVFWKIVDAKKRLHSNDNPKTGG